MLGKAALTEVLRKGCEKIKAGGYQAGVYASYSWFKEYIDAGVLEDGGNEIWMAYWQSDPGAYDYSDFCVTWQHSSTGRIDGLNGDVDRDLRYEALSADHPVTVLQPVGGTLTASKSSAGYGERIRLTAVPEEGYLLKNVYIDELPAHRSSDGSFYFTMPDGEAVVSAEMEEILYTLVPERKATVAEDGNTAYYIGSDGKYYQLADGRYSEIAEGSWVVSHLESPATEETQPEPTEAPAEPEPTQAPAEPETEPETMTAIPAEEAPDLPDAKLPLTGVNSGRTAGAAAGAAVLTVCGIWMLLRSRRKEENDD